MLRNRTFACGLYGLKDPKTPRSSTPWARSFCPFRACGAYLQKTAPQDFISVAKAIKSKRMRQKTKECANFLSQFNYYL